MDHDIDLNQGRFLVAYSGGLDSSVLVEAMGELRQSRQLTLQLVHIDHGLREASSSDARFCQEQAENWGLPIQVVQLEGHPEGGESVEAWARRERYGVLEQLRNNQNARYILTGHHLDDQAETVFMRLMQRSSLITLAGIRPVREAIARPLLAFSRDELRTYAVEKNIAWVEDETNTDARFLRNQIRHGPLQAALKADNSIRQTLAALAKFAQEYEKQVGLYAREIASQAERTTIAGVLKMPLAALINADEASQQMAIQSLVREHFDINMQLSHQHWGNFRHFVRSARVGKIFDLLKSVKMLKDRQDVFIFRAGSETGPDPVELSIGTSKWGGHVFETKRLSAASKSMRLRIRHWKNGDRVQMRKSSAGCKVSNLFVNASLNRLEKNHWPLVVNETDEIQWVPGIYPATDKKQINDWMITWCRP